MLVVVQSRKGWGWRFAVCDFR